MEQPVGNIFDGPAWDPFVPGDVWWVIGLRQTGAQGTKGRPIVILSCGAGNDLSLIPYLKVTSQGPTSKFPRVALADWREEGFVTQSFVQVDGPRTIFPSALLGSGERCGRLTEADQQRVSLRWHKMTPVINSRARSEENFEKIAAEVITG